MFFVFNSRRKILHSLVNGISNFLVSCENNGYWPAIPNVYCAYTCHSANVWVKIKVRVRFRVSGNSRLLE